MSERVEPMPIVCPVYEHCWSDYPDKIRVSMKDGKVIDYRREIVQPAPVLAPMVEQFTEVCLKGMK